MNPERSISVSINYFKSKPDLPSSSSIDMLRVFYRNQITEHNGGLLLVDFFKHENITGIETLFKIPLSPSGTVYLASLTIPFRSSSYVIKVQAREMGLTGVRDAVISDRLTKKGDNENWSADPYNPNFTDGTLMNRSEDPTYDSEFPDHPLSEARRIIAEIKKGMKFKPEIGELKEFKK